jgi:hypothetical protein
MKGATAMSRQFVTTGVVLCTLALAAGLGRATAGETPSAYTDEKIQALVKDLGHDDFDKRQAAEKELLQAGMKALAALKAAQNSPDPQVKTTAGRLEARIRLANMGAVDYLDVLPANCIIAAQLKNLGASRENAKGSAIGKLLASPELAALRQRLDAALNEKPDVWKAIQLWAGRFNGQFAMGFWAMDFQDPTKMRLAAMGEITDPAPQAVLDDFLKQTEFLPAGGNVENYKGVDIMQSAPGAPALALVGKHFVLAPNGESLKPIVDGFLNPGGLGATPALIKLKPALGPKPEFMLVVDFEKYMQEITKMFAAAPGGQAQGDAMQKLMACPSTC